MWKPVNTILKLYSENAYISYFFKLANINRFFKTTLHTYGCANPSRTFSFDRIYQALMTSRPLFFYRVVRPAPHLRNVPISLANTSTVYVRATAQLLFLQRFLFKSVVKSSVRTTTISPSEAKATWAGFVPVRGLQASACFPSTFSLLIRRCLGAEPKLFLWNSLIKLQRVGDVF